MIFATTSDFSGMWMLFIGMLVISFFWLIYMATFRPKQLGELYELDQKRRERQSERNKQLAGGALKTGVAIFRLFNKRR